MKTLTAIMTAIGKAFINVLLAFSQKDLREAANKTVQIEDEIINASRITRRRRREIRREGRKKRFNMWWACNRWKKLIKECKKWEKKNG